VSIFYITWHRDSLAGLKSPYAADVTKILAKDPAARLDAKNPLWANGMHHWGEPEMGYFLSKDPYVIRKDMSMLTSPIGTGLMSSTATPSAIRFTANTRATAGCTTRTTRAATTS
jgi:hypothetical protein